MSPRSILFCAFFFVTVYYPPRTCSAQENSGSLKIDVIPDMRWSASGGGPLSYHFNSTALTSYQGDFTIHQGGGIFMGFNAASANNWIGRSSIYNYFAGYIGWSKVTMQVENSRLTGNASWSGSLPSGEAAQTSFNSVFMLVDADYQIYPRADPTVNMVFGPSYAAFKLPMTIDTEVGPAGQYNGSGSFPGQSVYDADYPISAYMLHFGMGKVFHIMLDQKPAPGAPFLDFNERLGFGTTSLDAQTLAEASAANSGMQAATRNVIDFLSDFSLDAGMRWKYPVYGIPVSFGIGYKVGIFLVAAPNLSVVGPGVGQFEPLPRSYDLLSQGVLLRLKVAF
jgi:hypothetical protein